jgi:hypothetical protein
MIFCTACGKELHETAPMCPHCGNPQKAGAGTNTMKVDAKVGPLWAAITSPVLGAWCVLAEISGDIGTTSGCAMLAIAGLVLGIVSLNISKRGKGIAIAGIVISVIGLLGCVPS